ncbi:MAG TPA: hypothetical protein VFJ23_03365 [Candidatus Nitrosotalea sp.]|nr:hypothetical protein [Candidatus Nitrosotalea sp.]
MLITKHISSIFIGTDFERLARNAGITTTVFTGIYRTWCLIKR